MVQIDRRFLVLMMEAGYIYLGMQLFNESMDVFKGVSAMAPESDVPIVAMGSVEFCKGKFGKAITCYKKALKKDPDSLFAKAYMGEALFFSGKVEKATEILVEVTEKDPEGGAGGFADALIQAINDGFTPKMLAGTEVVENKNVKKK